jgi:hypothetical protein
MKFWGHKARRIYKGFRVRAGTRLFTPAATSVEEGRNYPKRTLTIFQKIAKRENGSQLFRKRDFSKNFLAVQKLLGYEEESSLSNNFVLCLNLKEGNLGGGSQKTKHRYGRKSLRRR